MSGSITSSTLALSDFLLLSIEMLAQCRFAFNNQYDCLFIFHNHMCFLKNACLYLLSISLLGYIFFFSLILRNS